MTDAPRRRRRESPAVPASAVPRLRVHGRTGPLVAARAVPPLRRRGRPEVPAVPASAVPALRSRGRTRLLRQPVLRRRASPLLALLLALGAHAGVAFWVVEGGARATPADVAVRSRRGGVLSVALGRPAPRPPAHVARPARELAPPEPPRAPPDVSHALPERPAPVREVAAAEPWPSRAAARPGRVRGRPRPGPPPEAGPASSAVDAASGPPPPEAAAPPPRPADEGEAAAARAAPEPAPGERAASSPGAAHAPSPRADNPAPRYPGVARRRGWQGRVVVHVVVDAAGSVERGEVVGSSGHAVLDEAALDAVLDWRFDPARDADGRAVPGARDVSVRFALQESSVAAAAEGGMVAGG